MFKELYKILIVMSKPNIDNIFVVTFFIVIIILTITFFAGPELMHQRIALHESVKGTDIASEFNNLIAPLIAIVAATLTFAAFWVQFKANEQQKRDLQVERFESKFYEMIKIHRDNVQEMSIDYNIIGRKAFTQMYYEFKYIYYTFKSKYETFGNNEFEDEKKCFELTNIAYLVFFWGVGDNSNIIFDDLLFKYHKMPFFKESKQELERFRSGYNRYKESKRPLILNVENERISFSIKYKPFSGHSGKLGHYFRHLFQTVKFVDEQNSEIIGEKYDYVKTLRAQLSNFEQILLYYNCISVLGNEWFKKEYIYNYEMVRNIPLPFVNFGVIPKEVFNADIKSKKMSFEWDEAKTKIDNFELYVDEIKRRGSVNN